MTVTICCEEARSLCHTSSLGHQEDDFDNFGDDDEEEEDGDPLPDDHHDRADGDRGANSDHHRLMDVSHHHDLDIELEVSGSPTGRRSHSMSHSASGLRAAAMAPGHTALTHALSAPRAQVGGRRESTARA